MKKVTLFLILWMTATGFAAAAGSSLTGTTPANFNYVQNTIITQSASITTQSNSANSFVDIMPLHPTLGGLDRTVWKRTTGELINVPFLIYKAGTTQLVKAIGLDTGVIENEVFSIQTKALTTVNFDIKISSNASAFMSGTYTKQLQLRRFDKNFSQWVSGDTPGQTILITMTLIVSSTLSVSVDVSNINFGNLTSNQFQNFNVRVDSNQPYSLALTSERGYKLDYWLSATSQYSPITGENVAYEVLINTKTFSQSAQPNPVASILSMSSPWYHQYGSTVTIKTISALTGGDYHDVLTFTVTAQ